MFEGVAEGSDLRGWYTHLVLTSSGYVAFFMRKRLVHKVSQIRRRETICLYAQSYLRFRFLGNVACAAMEDEEEEEEEKKEETENWNNRRAELSCLVDLHGGFREYFPPTTKKEGNMLGLHSSSIPRVFGSRRINHNLLLSNVCRIPYPWSISAAPPPPP